MSKILIKSIGDSFRRAGIAFTREGTVIDTEELSHEQLDALEKEPQLRAERYVAPEPEVDESKDDKAAGKPAKGTK